MTTNEAQRQAAPWVERFARWGYLVKGFVYVVVGALAMQAALGVGGRTTGASGALVSISRQPFGQLLLVAVATGLAGYALWRLVQGVLDVEDKGRDPKGLLKRFGYLVSGLAYGALAVEAARMVVGAASGGDGHTQELWTARVLAAPLGGWLVGAGAAVMFALAINAAVVALRRMYRKKLKLSRMSPEERRLADVTAIAGLLGRGTVFAMIGWFLVQAALKSDPQQAGASSEALAAISRGPHGAWLLAAVALGLVAYGGYAMVQARYRSIDPT